MRASQLEKTITALKLELQVITRAIAALEAQRAPVTPK